ncbi:MAG: hypothetical protein Kow0098_03020 [Ignavibacteriaceae bacterium]
MIGAFLFISNFNFASVSAFVSIKSIVDFSLLHLIDDDFFVGVTLVFEEGNNLHHNNKTKQITKSLFNTG